LKLTAPDGDKTGFTVAIDIRYAPTGTEDWTPLGGFEVTGFQQDPLFWGHRWPVDRSTSPTGRFDVAIRRLTADNPTENDEVVSTTVWSALRTITTEDPVVMPGMALLAMRVRPTELLHGTLDELSCILTSICLDYDAAAGWAYRPTRNPAALYRSLYQVAPQRTVGDAFIDTDRLEYWSERCAAEGFAFDAYVDWRMSRAEAARLVCLAGRAMPALRPGMLRSVAIDEPKTEKHQIFTPRNSWGYTGRIAFPKLPHGILVAFANASQAYKPDERVVYADGHTVDTATEIERVDFIGVTDPDLVWKHGRYWLAERARRRHLHTWFADIEALDCEPYDLVGLAQPVISHASAAGRILGLGLDGEDIVTVTLDIAVTMEDGVAYGLQVRTAERGVQALMVRTVPGESAVLELETPIVAATGPEVGELCVFGTRATEYLDVVLIAIEPGQDATARLTAVPAAPEIHAADQGPLPAWQSHISAARALPAPVVADIRSDATVMIESPSGVLETRAVITLAPVQHAPDIRVTVVQRRTASGGAWKVAAAHQHSATVLAIMGLDDGAAYDFGFQYTHPDWITSPLTVVAGYTVVGRLDPPQALSDLSLTAAGGAALLRWVRPAEADVRLGGTIVFRHSPLEAGASWSESVAIGAAAKGSDDHAWLPLKAGTYMARVYDAGGRPSADVAMVSTRQAALADFVPVSTLQLDPGFAGSHDGTEVHDGRLQLGSARSVDDVEDWDAIADLDAVTSGVRLEGTYYPGAGLDLGQVPNVRITTHVLALSVNLYDLIDDRTDPIDSWPDIDGVDGAPGDVQVWARLTDDDPAGTPTWGALTRLDAGEARCRAIGQIEVWLSTTDATYQVEVFELRIVVEQQA
jgi:hypothetical protein